MNIENGNPLRSLRQIFMTFVNRAVRRRWHRVGCFVLVMGGNDETESEWEAAELSRGNRRDEREVDRLGGSRCAVDFDWCLGAGACRLRHASG